MDPTRRTNAQDLQGDLRLIIPPDWRLLFGRVTTTMSVIHRNGAPFLYLPRERKAALATLSLYPAQKRKARVAKRLLKEYLRLGLSLPKVAMGDDPTLPLPAFMAGLTGSRGKVTWGMMAGNPRAAGQRLIFLLFNDQLNPTAVVKLGVTSEAVHLIGQEIRAVASMPPEAKCCLPVLGRWEKDGAVAVAYPYVAGDSPPLGPSKALLNLLDHWLNYGGEATLADLPDWQALLATPSGAKWWQTFPDPQRRILAPLTHGDLVPWNIKVNAQGQWIALDWERGQALGVPAWDWFHYELQPAMLVERLHPSQLLERAAALIDSPAFRSYAAKAHITGLEYPLLEAYWLYYLNANPQADGTSVQAEALALLQARRRTSL